MREREGGGRKQRKQHEHLINKQKKNTQNSPSFQSPISPERKLERKDHEPPGPPPPSPRHKNAKRKLHSLPGTRQAPVRHATGRTNSPPRRKNSHNENMWVEELTAYSSTLCKTVGHAPPIAPNPAHPARTPQQHHTPTAVLLSRDCYGRTRIRLKE